MLLLPMALMQLPQPLQQASARGERVLARPAGRDGRVDSLGWRAEKALGVIVAALSVIRQQYDRRSAIALCMTVCTYDHAQDGSH